MRVNKATKQENLIYAIVWGILFLAPVVSLYVQDRYQHITFSWHHVWHVWDPMLSLAVVFVIHNWLIAPQLIYKGRTRLYVVLLLSLAVVFQIYHSHHHPSGMPPHRHGKHPVERVMEDRQHDGPQAIDDDMEHRPHHGPRPPHGQQPVDMHDIIALLLMMLTCAANLGLKNYYKTQSDQSRLEDLERENLRQELEYLKYQFNPHFFMNTLNNIHALVDIDPQVAKKSIVDLSKMMRYVLYDGAKERVPLGQAIEFLNRYIALMRLRYTDKVTITFEHPAIVPAVDTPPLLFVPFVENAFKHGVSYARPSSIEVKFDIVDDHIVFTCANTKNNDDDDQEHGGVGLANVRKRLDLIYGERYNLTTTDHDDTYHVRLTIPQGV